MPWSDNLAFMRETREVLTPQRWAAEGFSTTLMGSITSDFLIGTAPVLAWMVAEGRRLGMRHLWAYVAGTFLVAFTCPLFLPAHARAAPPAVARRHDVTPVSVQPLPRLAPPTIPARPCP